MDLPRVRKGLHEVSVWSGALTYFTIMTLAPFMLWSMVVAGWLGNEMFHWIQEIVHRGFLTPQQAEILEDVLEEVHKYSRQAGVISLVIGYVASLGLWNVLERMVRSLLGEGEEDSAIRRIPGIFRFLYPAGFGLVLWITGALMVGLYTLENLDLPVNIPTAGISILKGVIAIAGPGIWLGAVLWIWGGQKIRQRWKTFLLWWGGWLLMEILYWWGLAQISGYLLLWKLYGHVGGLILWLWGIYGAWWILGIMLWVWNLANDIGGKRE